MKMNFSAVISNPPWSRAIAPKVIEKCLENTDNVVVLCPVNIYQKNIAGAHDKVSEKFKKSIDGIDFLSAEEVSKFKIAMDGDVGIMSFKKDGQYNWDDIKQKYTPLQKKVFDAIVSKNLSTIGDYAKLKTSGNHFMVVPTRHGNFRAESDDGKCWDYYDLFSRKDQIDQTGAKTNATVYFDTVEEAENFRISTQTIFYKFILTLFKKTTKSSLSSYPIMKDYKQGWTNERFYKEFGITENEQKEIETLMDKFK